MNRRQFGAWLVVFAIGLASISAADEATEGFRQGAELTDVVFLDGSFGWAVGDHGAIWHSGDGGRSWRLQPADCDCRLESVCFLDPQYGWTAGHESSPVTLHSVGVLLATTDGGQSWTRLDKLLLPGLKRIEMFDRAHGWALGQPSALFPSGVLLTDDGGLSWNPLPGTRSGGWLAGDLVQQRTGSRGDKGGLERNGALAGIHGDLVAFRGQEFQPAKFPNIGLRGVHRMHVAPDGRGWLAGDGGLVLATADLGQTWRPSAGQLPPAARHSDYIALFSRGLKCWIAGSPGSHVLYTADGGTTWTAHATGQSLPIRALWFADDRQGWAVGALGSILGTMDGGRSWKRLHGASRAAVLGVYGRPHDVPLELFARLSGNDGYLAAVQVLGRTGLETPGPADATLAERSRQALADVGIGGVEFAWGFPLRQAGLAIDGRQLVAGWDRSNRGHGLAAMEELLVRQIRCWRPEVVLTHAPSTDASDPLAHVIHQVVLRAVDRAADARQLPEQLAALRLEAWQVKKVYVPANHDAGSVTLSSSQLAPRLGRSLADQALLPRCLLGSPFDGFPPDGFPSDSPPTLDFRLASTASLKDAAGDDFFSGLTLPPGEGARRLLVDPAADRIEILRRAAQKGRNVQAILARASLDRGKGTQLVGQVDDLLGGLDDRSAGQVLFELGGRYHSAGQWESAAETYQMLADRYPRHPLSAAAMVWLVRYWSSGEAELRLRRLQRIVFQQAGLQAGRTGAGPVADSGPVLPASLLKASLLTGEPQTITGEPKALMPGKDQSNGGTTVLPGGGTAVMAERLERAMAAGRQLAKYHPTLHDDPAVGFTLISVARRQGRQRDATRFFQSQSRGMLGSSWRACAEAERWLENRNPDRPLTLTTSKAVLRCAGNAPPPLLDGKLDDATWHDLQPIVLESSLHDDADWPAVAWLACGDGYLYLAVRCRQAVGLDYTATAGPRTRDPDLSASDRVVLYLDVDRDWSTCYRLAIDYRGWTGEDCWGDRTWNPSWYVAAASEKGSWSVEAAIPLDELCGQTASGQAWALGIQRIVPKVGFQSWTRPAAIDPQPEGFGILSFE